VDLEPIGMKRIFPRLRFSLLSYTYSRRSSGVKTVSPMSIFPYLIRMRTSPALFTKSSRFIRETGPQFSCAPFASKEQRNKDPEGFCSLLMIISGRCSSDTTTTCGYL
jgi:hypothetical protein